MAQILTTTLHLYRGGYPKNVERDSDVIVRMFIEFIRNNGLIYSFPAINEAMIVACINETDIDVDYEYVKEFILNGQKRVKLMLSEE